MQDDEGHGRILVGVDASQGSRTAARWALEEARRRNAEVLAVYAWHIPAMAYSAPGYGVSYADDFVAGGLALIDDAIGESSVQDVKVEPRVVEGSPAKVLSHEAEQPDIELVVVGSRGHGGVTGLLLGSVSHALSHQCPKPLVIVPQAGSVEARGRIVVGIDGSSDADTALRWAAREARRREATLQVILACSDAKFAHYVEESGRQFLCRRGAGNRRRGGRGPWPDRRDHRTSRGGRAPGPGAGRCGRIGGSSGGRVPRPRPGPGGHPGIRESRLRPPIASTGGDNPPPRVIHPGSGGRVGGNNGRRSGLEIQ